MQKILKSGCHLPFKPDTKALWEKKKSKTMLLFYLPWNIELFFSQNMLFILTDEFVILNEYF